MASPIHEPHISFEQITDTPARTKQRLILCFDGTWNKRDSGTNIYHLSNLIYEGDVVDGDGVKWTQKIKYDEGVGTGLLDYVSGGAFGSGLSAKLREGYEWLVRNYNGADNPKDADEIYIFGFSRGAFTARSLIGLIRKCGLLLRGAPISLEQLWEGYQVLGRYPSARIGGEPEKNWWERIWGLPKRSFREIWELKRDPWETASRTIENPTNHAEELLQKWSRRIPVTCVGVFDTVGSMGVDALAIPWLRTKVAMFHDTTLSSIIVNGFHALALDEHRANFVHIPWHGEVVNGQASPRTTLGGRIEQRWFTGAHSNIGGGYENDVLAQISLEWMITECERLGLVFRLDRQKIKRPQVTELQPLVTKKRSQKPDVRDDGPHVRDSFAEFGGVLWQHFFRVKREYRQIAPPAELHYGKAMQSVNETVDDSVAELVANSVREQTPYLPLNFWEYCKKQKQPCKRKPKRVWVEGKGWRYFATWLIAIAFAGYTLGELLGSHVRLPQLISEVLPDWSLSWSLALTLPLCAGFVDWWESYLNYNVVLEPSGQRAERLMAFRDLCVLIRIVAIILFVFGLGAICFLAWRCPWLWQAPTWENGALPLLLLDSLWFCFLGVKSWCASPMKDAGLGSIVDLQDLTSSKKVVQYLVKTADTHDKTTGRNLLAPVARTIWRDIFGFIPAYIFLIVAGTWLSLDLLKLEPDVLYTAKGATFALAIVCALADWNEDRIHLRYLKEFPKLPSQSQVSIGNAMTQVKIVLFRTGIIATAIVTSWCAVVQMRFTFSLSEFGSGLGLFSAVFALLLLFGALMDFSESVRRLLKQSIGWVRSLLNAKDESPA